MNDWHEKLAYSRGRRELTDIEALRSLIPGCVEVVKTDEATDRSGVDYIATLRRGAQIKIDAKTRMPGARKYWRNGDPELPLEIWSVCNTKAGWALSEQSDVDYIYFTFDDADSTETYLIAFQHLRAALRQNWPTWRHQYSLTFQPNRDGGRRWHSQCLFVPADVVLRAIDAISRCRVTREMQLD